MTVSLYQSDTVSHSHPEMSGHSQPGDSGLVTIGGGDHVSDILIYGTG